MPAEQVFDQPGALSPTLANPTRRGLLTLPLEGPCGPKRHSRFHSSRESLRRSLSEDQGRVIAKILQIPHAGHPTNRSVRPRTSTTWIAAAASEHPLEVDDLAILGKILRLLPAFLYPAHRGSGLDCRRMGCNRGSGRRCWSGLRDADR